MQLQNVLYFKQSKQTNSKCSVKAKLKQGLMWLMIPVDLTFILLVVI